MNNFSLVAANRVTHLKVVVMALFFATLIIGVASIMVAMAGAEIS
jgi:hypothetical protein